MLYLLKLTAVLLLFNFVEPSFTRSKHNISREVIKGHRGFRGSVIRGQPASQTSRSRVRRFLDVITCAIGITSCGGGPPPDVNECSQGTDSCSSYSTCTNTDGSYYCTCHSGYYDHGGDAKSGCTPICHNYSPGSGQCQNGGTCNSPNSCSCRDEYYSYACNACPVAEVANCAHMRCSAGPSNKRCFECNEQYQSTIDRCVYTPNSAQNFCDQRCSWVHHHCFPGSCSSGYPTTCSCATGFTSSGNGMCDLTIRPELLLCKITVKSTSSELRQSQPTNALSTSCYTEGDEWIKFIPAEFKLDFEASFQHPGYNQLAYVRDYSYGITKSSVEMYKVPAGSNVDLATYTMPGAGSCTPNVLGNGVGQPTDQLTCDIDKTLSYQNFVDGDKLCFKFEAISGGYTRYKNPNNNVNAGTQTYSDQARSKDVCVRMDFTFPTHCSRDSGASACASPSEYMTFGDRIRKTGVVTLNFPGWQDLSTNPSGIKEYVINVYEIAESTTTTVGMVFSPVKVGPLTVLAGTTQRQFTLPAEPQFYAIDLTVVDNALNVKQARSYVLYDASSQLLTDSSKEFYFTSATQVTDYLWQTNLNSITLSWTDYFYNDYHRTHAPLRPVDAEPTYYTETYDQKTGILPRSGTDNIHGILEFKYHIEELTPIGSQSTSTSEPTSWTDVTTWLDEDLTLGSSVVTPADGDTYKVWIQGTDIMDNQLADQRIIHFDSSLPELWDMWLTKDGHNEVYIHDWHELHTMKLVFRAHDVHSGLRKVFYRLGTTTGGSSEHGQGSIPVVKLGTGVSCPVGGDPCYCPSIGPCEMSSYLLDLNPIVANTTHVGLHNRDYFFEIELENEARLVKTFELKIFTDNSPPVNGTVWDGGPNQKDVDYKSDNSVVGSWLGFVDHESGILYYRYAVDDRCWTTDELYASGTQTTSTTTGSLTTSLTHYYVSVIAINNAITSSVPSCSDGVIVDSTAPVFGSYTVKHGIFTNGQPPIYHHKDSLELTWVFTEAESQIRDYEIGFASNIANTASPDVVGYQSTDMKSHFKKLHTGFGQASRVFVMIKAINKVGLEAVEAIGPFVIDQTPPTTTSTFTPSVGSTQVTLSWSASDFADNEDENALTSFRWALGTSDNSQELVPFTDVTGSGGNYQVQYSVQNIIDHDNEFDKSYFFSIECFNTVRLSAIFESETFEFDTTQPPPAGVVYDVDDDVNADVEPDADFQFGTSKLCGKWSGFDHFRDTVTYEAGVGTTRGAVDIQSFANVNTAVSHCFTGLSLTDKTTYYFSVRATGTIGDVTVSSDGVTVIDEASHQSEVDVFDGPGCDALSTCSDDISNQASRMHVAAWWRSNGNLDAYFTHYKVGVVEDDCTQGANSISCSEVGLITSMVNVGKFDRYVFGNQILDNGKQYHVKVSMCFHTKCLPSVQSSGVMIYSEPVAASTVEVDVTSVSKVNDSLTIAFDAKWNPFSVTEGTLASKALEHKWAVTSEPDGVGPITPWMDKTTTFATTKVEVSHELFLKHRPLKPIYISVKGYNPLGSFAIASTPLPIEIGTTGIDEGHYVFDLNGTASVLNLINSEKLGEKSRVLHGLDVDYTLQPKTVSAAVTGINYPWYIWYITTEPSAVHHYIQWSYNLTDYPVNGTNATMPMPFGCDHGMAECIGDRIYTQNNYVTITGLTLAHGTKYYTCVHSNKTTVVRETSTENLPELSMCSNGFVLDTTPPTEGTVTVHTVNMGYTQNNREMVISWTGFTDVEEIAGNGIIHSTGIKTYKYGIGSTPGAVDVRSFTDVGESQGTTATGLNLESGKTYYAVVRAIDHVGLTTDAVSSGVIVDTTPPVPSFVRVGSSQKHLPAVKCDRFEVHWGDFIDDHSSTIKYKIAVGTHEHSQDISPFTDAYHNFEVFSGLSVIKGHHYYAQISATNAVGLTVHASSLVFTCDSTGPAQGFVYDGPDRTQGDWDYQQDKSLVSTNWFGFQDGETTVQYQVAVGTSPGEQDIHPFVDVGAITAYTFIVGCVPGVKFYTTVMACNQVDMCSTATSDGVIADDSPPLPGIIRVGFDDFHSVYQAETSSITIRWFGFHDPHSFLHHYEWCIGNDDADDCSEVAYTNAHLSQEVHKGGLSLTPHVKLYVKIKATNNADLVTVTSSNHFMIDNTAPTVTTTPAFNVDGLSRKANTQYDRSVVRATWQFADAESRVVRHVVSVKSHDDNEHPVSDFQMDAATHVTFDLAGARQMADGDEYWLKVSACNAAGLCTTETSSALLVDSTPPHLGHFKHTLTYGGGGSTASLEWEEFHEGQSGIDKYVVAFGSTYHSWDILAPTDVVHDGNSAVQSETFSLTQSINVGDVVYITIYAVNGAGMTSDIGQTSVLVISPNELFIQRHSCVVFGCKKVCSCGEYGGTFYNCRHDGAETSCNDVSTPGLTVVDGLVLNSDEDYSASDKCLSGSWSTHNNAVRYEWGFGMKNDGIGSDLFNSVTERFIFDNGLVNKVAYCLPFNKQLDHDAEYSLYVRYFWNANQYTEVMTDGVLVDHTAPSVARGYGILDIALPSGTADIEYTTSTSAIYARWENTFVDRGSGIHHYEVMVGTTMEGNEIVDVEDVGATTAFAKTGLNIPVGTKYYVTVRAVNNVGLTANKTSDGVVIDNEAPIAGVVFNGRWKHCHRFMSSEDTLEISWIGFSDRHSFIQEYQWGIGDNEATANVKAFASAGIHNRVSNPRVDLTHGSTYYILVKAVDASGQTTTVASPPFTYDETPPTGYVPTSLGSDVVSNGAFTTISNTAFTGSWTVTGTSSFDAGTGVTLTGQISQNINIPAHDLYQLKVETTPPCARVFSTITIGNHSVFLDLRDELTNCKYVLDIPLEEASGISFGLQENSEITLKTVSLKSVSATAPLDSAQSVTIRQLGMMDLFVHWSTTDFESRIRHTEIGLGSTPGGLQIAPLANVGRKPFKMYHQLPLKHALPVYASLLIVNEAGVQTTIISAPIKVDWVAPDIRNISMSYVVNNPTSIDVTADWIVDAASGMDVCYWALGLVRGSLDVLDWSATDSLLSSTASALNLNHGDRVYPSLRCISHSRLEGTAVGDSLLIVTGPPDVSSATVSAKPLSRYRFDAQEGFQSNTDILDLTIDGFQDAAGIVEYQAKVEDDEGQELLGYQNLNLVRHTHFVLANFPVNDVDLYNETCYNVSLLPATTTVSMTTTRPVTTNANATTSSSDTAATTTTQTTTTAEPTTTTTSPTTTTTAQTTTTTELLTHTTSEANSTSQTGQNNSSTTAGMTTTTDPGPQYTVVCERDYFIKTYTVSVKAINAGGLESSPVATTISLYLGSPLISGRNATLHRNNVTNDIFLDWQHVFNYTGPGTLRFGVSIGLNDGTANVVNNIDTVDTNHQIPEWIIKYSKDYHAAITAITPHGTYATFTSKIENPF